MTIADARFEIRSWDETPFDEAPDLPKLTRARVRKTLTGDIEGEGNVEYLMMYRPDGSATFVGLERIVGSLNGRTGSFVPQRTGVFEGGQARESYSVIAGSGTVDLLGLEGTGRSDLGHGREHPFLLEFQID